MPERPIQPKSEWLTHVDERERIYVPAPIVRHLQWPPGALVQVIASEHAITILRVTLNMTLGKAAKKAKAVNAEA